MNLTRFWRGRGSQVGLRVYIAWFLAVMAAEVPSLSLAEVPDRRQLREELKELWVSLMTFEFECKEFLQGVGQGQKGSKSYLKTEFAHKKDNRWSCRIGSVRADGTYIPGDWLRQDGVKRQQINPFPAFPNEIASVHIQSQESTPDEYADIKFSALWSFMPGGKPIYVYLDEGGQIDAAPEAGPDCVALTTKYRGSSLKCILDGKHDWLPLKVELRERDILHVNNTTTRFQRDNNRWFPAEGEFEVPAQEGSILRLFYVENLSINRPIDDKRFALPALPGGVRVVDDVKNTVYFTGVPADFSRRREQFGDKVPKNEPIQKLSIKDGFTRGIIFKILIGCIGGTSLIFLALKIRFRNELKHGRV